MTRQEFYQSIKNNFNHSIIKKVGKKITDYLCKGYIISYPKSGRSLITNLITYYLIFEKSQEIDRFHATYDPFIYSLFTKYPNIKVTHGVSHFQRKPYCPPSKFRERIQTERYINKNTIFLIRDPRNVIVSYYYHYKKNNKEIPIDNFIKDKEKGLNRVIQFYNAIVPYLKKNNNFKYFCFEDLIQNKKLIFKQILKELDFSEINERSFKKVIKQTDFKTQKQREKEYRRKNNLSLEDNDFRLRKGNKKSYEKLKQKNKNYIEKKISNELNNFFEKYHE